MNFRPKQYYVEKMSVPTAPKKEKKKGMNVYHRTDEGKLGQFTVGTNSYEEAILIAKEGLVAEGDGLENKAVLAVIEGGKIGN